MKTKTQSNKNKNAKLSIEAQSSYLEINQDHRGT